MREKTQLHRKDERTYDRSPYFIFDLNDGKDEY